MRNSILIFFLVLVNFSIVHSQQENKNKSEFSILFVGNSLTYSNNLPQLVVEYAKQKNIQINTEMIALPNYAIEDHWNNGQVQKLISSKTFDFVIIQQGPSSQSDGRRMLIEYGKKFSELCKLNNSQLCYFMVWPSLNYYHSFDSVIKNHEEAATLNNSILLPVGKLWKEHIKSSENTHLYDTDGFHPSVDGSQFAAKVIVDYLFEN